MSAKFSSLLAKINLKFLNHLILIFAAGFIAFTGILYWRASETAIESLNEQTLHREQVVARAGAKSIEEFLELLGLQIAGTATRDSIIGKDEGVEAVLEAFIGRWGETAVSGILRTDKEGLVLFNATESGPPTTQVDVSDRSYFAWAKNAKVGETFVSEPIISRVGASKGKYVIGISTPVFFDDEFGGVLTVGVVIPDLARDFLDPLKLSEDTRVYLVDKNGVMLYAPYEKLTGVNWFDYLDSGAYPGSDELKLAFANALSKPHEGKMNLRLFDEKTGKLTRFLISYSPVIYEEDSYWVLGIASPVREAELFFGPFRDNQSLGLIFGITGVIGFSLVSILAIRIARRDAYLDGFVDGREECLRDVQTSRKTPKGK